MTSMATGVTSATTNMGSTLAQVAAQWQAGIASWPA